MIVIEPRKLRICRHSGSRFGVRYRSRSTFPCSVPPAITCRCARGCRVVAGRGERRRTASGVCRCLSRVDCQRKACSRSPHRGCPSSLTCWLTRRVRPRGWDIGIDSLTTQLVINRRLSHEADTLEALRRGLHHRGVYRLWSGYEIVCTGCGWVPATRNLADPTGQCRADIHPAGIFRNVLV
jgi:hypothetical protein